MNYQSKSLDHLGLVAGMYDELGIGCKLDELIRQDTDQRLVSIGQICKALVLNGLGFTQRVLYQVSSFFERYPAEQLIGPGVSASMLNDSVLGRGLDLIHEYGTTELFAQLAPEICARLGLEGRCGHMDITSFHLDGEYNADNPPAEDAKVIHLTRGYSRDHRPDLNQAVLNLIVENRAGIPLHMEALSGNSNDSKQFRQTIDTHIDQLNHAYELTYLMMDSAGYTEETIALLGSDQKWISRVPETLGLCKELVASADPVWQPLASGYQYQLREQTYGGVAQRWLLIHSAQAEARELKTLTRSYAKKTQKEYDQVQQLTRQAFDCEKDALKAFKRLGAKVQTLNLKLLELRQKACYDRRGRPPQGSLPDRIEWYVVVEAACSIEAYRHQARSKGRFVLATNELDAQALTDGQILGEYKGQAKVERGFRFLKDPQFVASSFFVKKPERLEALVFIMTLCLCVYAAIEYRIRQQLKDQQQTLPNQLGKEVQNPTARWVFQLFAGIHLLSIQSNGQHLVINLKPIHLKIMKLIGSHVQKYYLVPT